MNKEIKIVSIGAILLIIGLVFLQFDFIPIGATLMGIGGFTIWFGPLFTVDFDKQ